MFKSSFQLFELIKFFFLSKRFAEDERFMTQDFHNI